MGNIADKISKIIAKAESTSHPEEADLFMMKAHEMLEAHGLSLSDLGRLQSDDPIDVTYKAGHWFAAEGAFRHVAIGLARYYGCQIVFRRVSSARWEFDAVGRENARVTTSLMFPFVKTQIRKMARESHKRGEYKSVAQARHHIANALTFRLQALCQQQEGTRPAGDAGNPNALVPVDLVRQALEDAFPSCRTTRRVRLTTSEKAKELAEQVAINRQTRGSKARQIERN